MGATPSLFQRGGMGVASCYLFTIRGVFFIMAPLCKEPAHPLFMAPLCKGTGCHRQTEGLYGVSLHFFGEKM